MSSKNITEEINDYSERRNSAMPEVPTGYSKEALAKFKRLNYMTGLNGHYEYASANSLRNSVKVTLNMDGMFDRFKVAPGGGYYATTHFNESTFKKNVSFIF